MGISLSDHRNRRRSVGLPVFFLAGILAFICFVPALQAAEENKEEESAASKAASELISSMPDIFKGAVAMEKMSSAQKIDFVLNAAEGKVYEKVTGKVKDEMKSALEEFVKRSVRAHAFINDVLPKIKTDIIMSGNKGAPQINWSMYEADMGNTVAEKTKMFAVAWDSVEIGYKAYCDFAAGGISAGLTSIGGSLADKAGELYIPGYSYVKIGADMVEALGKFVLSYATDTAVEGMLEDMYGIKGNSKGFVQWIREKTPSAIRQDVESKWNDGAGYGRVWEGQGTDKGDEAMMQRLVDELVKMRGAILMEEKNRQGNLGEVEKYFEKVNADVVAAQDRLKAVGKKAQDDAQPYLSRINDFKRSVHSYKKEEIKKREEEVRQEIAAIGVEAAVSYTPIDMELILTMLETAFAEIKASGQGGFDGEIYNRYYDDYMKTRARVIEEAEQANAQAQKQKYDEINKIQGEHQRAFEAQYNAIVKKYSDRAQQDAELEVVRAQYRPAANQYAKTAQSINASIEVNQKRFKEELALLGLKEELLKTEAQGRGAQMAEFLKAAMGKIRESLAKTSREFEMAMQTLEQERAASQEAVSDPLGLLLANAESHLDYADGLHRGTYRLDKPGDMVKQYQGIKEAMARMGQNAQAVASLRNREKEAYKAYIAGVQEAFSEYSRVIPKNLQQVSQEGDGRESWGVSHFQMVASPGSSGDIRPSQAEARARLEKLSVPFNAKQHDAIAQRALSALEGIASIDELALSINRQAADAFKKLEDFKINGSEEYDSEHHFYIKRPEYAGTVTGTFGEKYLQDMKAAWSAAQPKLNSLLQLKQRFGKGIRYNQQDPAEVFKKLDAYTGIEGKIVLFEKGLKYAIEKAKKEDAANLVEIKAREDEFRSLERDGVSQSNLKKLTELRELVNGLAQMAASGRKQNIKQGILALKQKLDALVPVREKEWAALKDQWARATQTTAANNTTTGSSAGGSGNGVGGSGGAQMSPSSSSMQRVAVDQVRSARIPDLSNARLNTRSLQGVSGEVRLTRDDMRQNIMEITARLSGIDGVSGLLFSEDAGRTWIELPLSLQISHAIVPLPMKPYKPVIKIKTSIQEVLIEVFPGVEAIVFDDTDYTQMAMQAVASVAEAYEKMNVGAFSDLISRDFTGNKTALEEGVRFDFDMFMDIQLKIFINKIEKKTGLFICETKWDKSQVVRKTGLQQKTSGRTTFVFAFEDGKMKIKNLRGDLIYATLSPEIAQASGLSQAKVEEIRTAEIERNPIQPGAETTEDAGGVTSSTTLLSSMTETMQKDVDTKGYSFSPWMEGVSGSGDMDYESNIVLPNGSAGIKDMTGVSSYEDLDTAPDSGYVLAGDTVGLNPGGVYAFVTQAGKYGKFKVNSLTVGPPDSCSITFAVQTDGSRNIQTQ